MQRIILFCGNDLDGNESLPACPCLYNALLQGITLLRAEQSFLCSLLESSSLETGEAASTRVCVQANGCYRNTCLNTSQLGFGSVCMLLNNKPSNNCILQPSLGELVQHGHNPEKTILCVGSSLYSTKHGVNRGSYSEKAPSMLHEGEAPPLRGCCHACCSLASGGERQTFHGFALRGCHTDLPQEAAQGRKLPCEIAI